jgi:hypothetical protein
MTGTAHKIKQKLKEVTSPSPPPPPTDTNNSGNKLSISNLLHHKSNSTSTSTSTGQSGHILPGQGAPIQAIESGDSIASDPSNYLTDQQLEQDLVLEEMAEKEHEIGHQGRSGSTVSAPPSVPAPEKSSGGMYGGNLFGHGHGHGGGGGGKKKGSKQKFAERQVCPNL